MKSNTFTTLGVLIAGLILVAIGFYGATMLGGQSMGGFTAGSFFGTSNSQPSQASAKEALPLVLSSAQKNALISLGIDPAKAPSSISAAQQNCFIANLGEEEFATFKSGAVPSMLDYVKVKSCF